MTQEHQYYQTRHIGSFYSRLRLQILQMCHSLQKKLESFFNWVIEVSYEVSTSKMDCFLQPKFTGVNSKFL